MASGTLVDVDFPATFRRAQRGSDDAVRTILDQFLGPVEHYLRRRGVADPESTANMVLERSIRTGDPDRIHNEFVFRSYVFTIARNEVVDARRRSGRRVAIDLVDDPARHHDTDTAVVLGPEEQVLSSLGVEELLSLVSDEQAEVLELRLLEGQTLESTAAILGKSIPAVTSLQHRGVLRLRRALAVVVLSVVAYLASGTPFQADAPVIIDDSGVVEIPTADLQPEKGPGASETAGDDVPDRRAIGGGTTDRPTFTDAVQSVPGSADRADIDAADVESATRASTEATSSAATSVPAAGDPTASPTAQAQANGIVRGAGCVEGRGTAARNSATCAGSLVEVVARRGPNNG